jgi:hypothetical protein
MGAAPSPWNTLYLMCHIALLLLKFIAFRVLDSVVNYDQSKRVMKVDGFDRSKSWEAGNVDISISSKKIKLCSLRIIRNTMLFIFQIEMFSFSSISGDYISLQAPCQIFVNRSAWHGRPISRSLASNVQIHFIYIASNTVTSHSLRGIREK